MTAAKKLFDLVAIILIYWFIQLLTLFQLAPRIFSTATLDAHSWISLYEHHLVQLLLALLLIGIFSRGNFSAWGLNFGNRKESWRLLLWFLPIYSVCVLFVNVLPPIINHDSPTFDFELTPLNIIGWLSFEGVFGVAAATAR